MRPWTCRRPHFLTTFDSPASAITCARAVIGSMREIGVDLRIGLHTGECDIVGSELRGIAVHIGARVASQAAAGEGFHRIGRPGEVVAVEAEEHVVHGNPRGWRRAPWRISVMNTLRAGWSIR